MVTLFLCGDVMTGRGVDQVLRHPGDGRLREAYCRHARDYVQLAEAENGTIPRPVNGSWLWGDALALLDALAPDARVINLETAITDGDDFAQGKSIHYRMNPANIGSLTVARPDVCVLANNHVLDFGRHGLGDTLDALARAGLGVAGSGRDETQAAQPATVPLTGGGHVVVFAAGTASSGIGPGWAARPGRAGVNYLPALTGARSSALAGRVRSARHPGDILIVSLHWGPNWGYEPRADEISFAHSLVEAGADIVHGHSAHHPRPVEVYRSKLILYGCGDFIDDYEGIKGYEHYRDDLRLAWFPTVDAATGALTALRIAPFQARRMRLHRAGEADTRWLADLLSRISSPFGSQVETCPGDMLTLRLRYPDSGPGAGADIP